MYQGKHNCTKMSKLSPSSGHCGTRSNLSKNRLICYDYHPHNVLGFKTRGKNYISRSVAFLQCFKNDFPKGLSQKLQHHHHFHRIQYFCFSLLSCNFSPVWLFFLTWTSVRRTLCWLQITSSQYSSWRLVTTQNPQAWS